MYTIYILSHIKIYVHYIYCITYKIYVHDIYSITYKNMLFYIYMR